MFLWSFCFCVSRGEHNLNTASPYVVGEATINKPLLNSYLPTYCPTFVVSLCATNADLPPVCDYIATFPPKFVNFGYEFSRTQFQTKGGQCESDSSLLDFKHCDSLLDLKHFAKIVNYKHFDKWLIIASSPFFQGVVSGASDCTLTGYVDAA